MAVHSQRRTGVVVKKSEPVPKEESKQPMVRSNEISKVVKTQIKEIEDDELISDIMKSDSAPTDKTIGTKHSTQ
jgi:Tfp pilus assembly major pilin PilA